MGPRRGARKPAFRCRRGLLRRARVFRRRDHGGGRFGAVFGPITDWAPTFATPMSQSNCRLAARGICNSRKCLITLEEGSEGWTAVDGNIVLPAAACRPRPDGRPAAITLSTACTAAKVGTPNCGAWSSATTPIDRPPRQRPSAMLATGSRSKPVVAAESKRERASMELGRAGELRGRRALFAWAPPSPVDGWNQVVRQRLPMDRVRPSDLHGADRTSVRPLRHPTARMRRDDRHAIGLGRLQ